MKVFLIRLLVRHPACQSNQPDVIVAAKSRAAALRALRASGFRSVSDGFLRDYGSVTSNPVQCEVALAEPGAVFAATGFNGYGSTVSDWVRIGPNA